MTHTRYNPRNCNRPTGEAPKSTSRWFDHRKEQSSGPRLFGFTADLFPPVPR